MNLTRRQSKIAEQAALINEQRELFRLDNVTANNGVTYQHDPIDRVNFKETLDNYDNITAMRDPTDSTKQLWKAADNTILSFTKVEFTALVAELSEKKAQHYAAAFEYAEGIKTLLPLPDDSPLFDRGNWSI